MNLLGSRWEFKSPSQLWELLEGVQTCAAILTTGWSESISRSARVPPFRTPVKQCIFNEEIYPQLLYCKRLPCHTGQEQACYRITQLFVCSFVCHDAKNGPIHRKMFVDCPLMNTSKVKLFFRPDKTRKREWMIQVIFCIVDAGSCFVRIRASHTYWHRRSSPTSSIHKTTYHILTPFSITRSPNLSNFPGVAPDMTATFFSTELFSALLPFFNSCLGCSAHWTGKHAMGKMKQYFVFCYLPEKCLHG